MLYCLFTPLSLTPLVHLCIHISYVDHQKNGVRKRICCNCSLQCFVCVKDNQSTIYIYISINTALHTHTHTFLFDFPHVPSLNPAYFPGTLPPLYPCALSSQPDAHKQHLHHSSKEKTITQLPHQHICDWLSNQPTNQPTKPIKQPTSTSICNTVL